jgi:hypothetical protein
MVALTSQPVQLPLPVQSNFSDRVKKQNGQERFWMHRRDAISVESGGTAMKESRALDVSKVEETDEKCVHNGEENLTAAITLKETKEKDEHTPHEINCQTDRNDRRKQRKAKRDANMAAYGRKKRRDPLLEARLSLLGLANTQSNGIPASQGSVNVEEKRMSAENDRHEDMAESAAVTSPAFGLMVPYNTMSSILSDVSYEEGSLMSHSISYQSTMAVDEMHRRDSESNSMNFIRDSVQIRSKDGKQSSSLNPPSTPKHESTKSTLLAYIQASPAITENSRASSGSTVNTSILFPNRESQRSSLGMLLIANDDIFPKPPIRRGYDTFSDDGTILARGALDMDEETPKARPIEIDEFDYRDKPLPAIRDSSEDDRTIRQFIPPSSPIPSLIRDGPNFLQAQNAIGLSLMPTSVKPTIPSKSYRKKPATFSSDPC